MVWAGGQRQQLHLILNSLYCPLPAIRAGRLEVSGLVRVARFKLLHERGDGLRLTTFMWLIIANTV